MKGNKDCGHGKRRAARLIPIIAAILTLSACGGGSGSGSGDNTDDRESEWGSMTWGDDDWE